MASEGVQPLRINKHSPGKMSGSAIPRPLGEISPMGVRRNSPSFTQSMKKPSITSGGDSSPFDASPGNSPLSFWKSRENVSPQRFNSENTQNENISPSPHKRSSVENLKRASRVTNSTMYAREQESDYDPDNSSMLSNRPLSAYTTNTWGDLRSNPSFRGHKRTESNTKIPILSRTPSPTKPASPPPSTSAQTSPQKSSLSSNTRFGPQGAFGPDDSIFEDAHESRPATGSNTPRALRQPKSVSFDERAPQINEYEMITPDPSSIASGSREGSQESDVYDMDDSFEHGSFEREDSFDESLEDADKTPVVLPEDWRFMSPEAANTGLADTFEDPFEKPPPVSSPSTRYRGTPERGDVGVARSNSVASDHRPLPPLPGGMSVERTTSATSASAAPQPRPSSVSAPPRPASMSKAEILGMRASPMPLEERLELLSIQNEEAERKAAETRSRESIDQVDEQSTEQAAQGPEPSVEYKPPPRVSRESILRKVQSRTFDDYEQEPSSPVAPIREEQDIDYANLDPDEPIPSRETSSTYEDDVSPPIRHAGPVEQTIDMYDRADDDEAPRSVSPFDDFVRDSSVIHHQQPDDVSEMDNEETVVVKSEPADEETTGKSVPEIYLGTAPEPFKETEPAKTPEGDHSRMSLPEFSSFFDKDDDFGFGLSSYLTPSPPNEEATRSSRPATGAELMESKPDLRPSTPVQQIHPDIQADNYADSHPDQPVDEVIGTPESVIHHPEDEGLAEDQDRPLEESSSVQEPEMPAPEVPEPKATIKASGSKLKTRVSATPYDIQQMAATRRQVSCEQPPPSMSGSQDGSRPVSREFGLDTGVVNRRQSLRQLDLPMGGVSEELGQGLNEEFERLLEGKKKGYLMRHNTKVVVANSRQPSGESKASQTSNEERPMSATSETRPTSSKDTRSAGNTPRKDAAQTWTTEPWNGRMRRQSTRRTNIVSEKRTSLGPAPPMPGQESNITNANALDTVSEYQPVEDTDESGERGRLFVKVVGVKDLELPLPRNERSYFQMTLDNGLHCVTTSWAELGRTAPIGQEFELVVFDDLEFQLLLQTRLERPKSAASSVQSTVSSTTAKKPSALSRLFTSPKKRREQEQKQQEEEARVAADRQKEIEAMRANREPSAWDLQNELVGPDGSFARSYIALSNHEQQAYGRPFTVDIPAWNEWAVEDKTGASTRSKMGGVQRKPPYKIGNIELQLMYVPRPQDATDEDMPKSMSAAIRQLKEAEATVTRSFEGHLSQQGGDCPYWRRRFFKLNGSKLTAYHDMTRQPRATISLAKAAKLIDDKARLTKTDGPVAGASPTKTKGRRKSAFAEDEEGYMFVEEGFRIRFANGEVIDFYADSREQKDEWMRVLSEAVGRESPSEKKTWMSIVLARERAAGHTQPKPHQVQENQVRPRNTSKSAPTSPQKPANARLNAGPFTNGGLKENRPPPPEKSPRHEVPVSPTKSKHKTSASTSTPVSPNKPAQSRSPLKRDSSPSKRNSATAAGGSTNSNASSTSPRKGLTGKRQAVRSMIF